LKVLIQFYFDVLDQAGALSSPGPLNLRLPLPVISQIQIEPSVVENVSHFESGEKDGVNV